jgi:D-alanyl-D-alanine carboxypeptidase-like protein
MAIVVVLAAMSATLLQCRAPDSAQPAKPGSSSTATTRSTTTPHATPTSTSSTPSPAAVHPVTVDDLGATWRPGCPVGPELLRRVEVNYVGFDGQTHRGELVVHQDVVADVIAIFEQLHRMHYPIAKMRTVADYPGAEDELSMEDNNTSAFNCRGIPGSDRWSEHAYGRAIDVNPLLNPYINSSGEFEPHNAAAFLDRSRTDPGLLHDGDPAVRVFIDSGWRWGGHWTTPIDYQHFERS